MDTWVRGDSVHLRELEAIDAARAEGNGDSQSVQALRTFAKMPFVSFVLAFSHSIPLFAVLEQGLIESKSQLKKLKTKLAMVRRQAPCGSALLTA